MKADDGAHPYGRAAGRLRNRMVMRFRGAANASARRRQYTEGRMIHSAPDLLWSSSDETITRHRTKASCSWDGEPSSHKGNHAQDGRHGCPAGPSRACTRPGCPEGRHLSFRLSHERRGVHPVFRQSSAGAPEGGDLPERLPFLGRLLSRERECAPRDAEGGLMSERIPCEWGLLPVVSVTRP